MSTSVVASDVRRTAVALLRVSTDRQAESGLGLEGQRAAIVSWAASHNVEVVDWHTEAGVSGGAALADRPELLDALAAVKETSADGLIVSCVDRLARSVLTLELVRSELDRVGAVIWSADGSGNDDSAESRMIRTILGAVAEFERAKTAMRTHAALRARRARGERVGPPVFGEGNATEQAALVRCRELAEAGHSQGEIAKRLAAEGFTSRKGGPIGQSWVSRRLAA